MNTDTVEGATPDDPRDPETDKSELPLTAAGERSTSIEEDDDAGILPTPEPTDGGAPAP